MQTITPILPGRVYHIYCRGINGEDLFKNEMNYEFFLRKYHQYISPIADTISYCLLKNHFHFMVRIKHQEITRELDNNISYKLNASRQFGHLFNSYAQAINKRYNRTGGLFESPFRRKEITKDDHFGWLIWYIHYNPQNHGLIDDFAKWKYSSFNEITSGNFLVTHESVAVNWFGGKEDFLKFHIGNKPDCNEMIIE